MKNGIGNLVGLLKVNVIPSAQSSRLYNIKLLLKIFRKQTKRGKGKHGSKMVIYGMYENHLSGWFVHKDGGLYALAEEFASEVCHYLKVSFMKAMIVLEKNLVNESLSDGEGRFTGIPFTMFSVTRDYFCTHHSDDNDYGYGFIFWLYPSGELRMDACSTFWLLEYKVSYSLRNRSIFLLNFSSIIHCTTKPFEVGVLSFAFTQKGPLIVQFKRP